VGPARRLQGLATPGALIGRPDRCPGADANFGSGPKPTPARWRASNAAGGTAGQRTRFDAHRQRARRQSGPSCAL